MAPKNSKKGPDEILTRIAIVNADRSAHRPCLFCKTAASASQGAHGLCRAQM
jgi:hypothetical protein